MSQRKSPRECHQLIQEEGYYYIDVRSEQEFAQGHPEGAFNVPVVIATDYGMLPNPDFIGVVRSNFQKETALVIGCGSGGRSAQAVQQLEQVGYTNLVDNQSGFNGVRDKASGEIQKEGWSSSLPSSVKPLPGRSYGALSSRTQGA